MPQDERDRQMQQPGHQHHRQRRRQGNHPEPHQNLHQAQPGQAQQGVAAKQPTERHIGQAERKQPLRTMEQMGGVAQIDKRRRQHQTQPIAHRTKGKNLTWTLPEHSQSSRLKGMSKPIFPPRLVQSGIVAIKLPISSACSP